MGAPAIDKGELAPSAAALRELRLDIEEFNFAYAATLDDGKLAEWPDFFTDDAFYRKHMGGRAFIAHYLLSETPAGVDAFLGKRKAEFS